MTSAGRILHLEEGNMLTFYLQKIAGNVDVKGDTHIPYKLFEPIYCPHMHGCIKVTEIGVLLMFQIVRVGSEPDLSRELYEENFLFF